MEGETNTAMLTAALNLCPVCANAAFVIEYPSGMVKIYCAECAKLGEPTEVLAEGSACNRASAARLWNGLAAKFQDVGADK